MKIFLACVLTAAVVGLGVFVLTRTSEGFSEGSAIDEFSAAMEAEGYQRTRLAVVPTKNVEGAPVVDDSRALSFWLIDRGTLMVTHSTATGEIENMSFVVPDERPRSKKTGFTLSIDVFQPRTGRMIVLARRS